MLTIAKFGGSSLADGAAFQTVRELVLSDASRCGVVVSAPGKRFADDPKVTDLLYLCHELWKKGRDWQAVFQKIACRFRDICRDTNAALDIEQTLQTLRNSISKGVSRDFLASRGEYLNAKILAAMLGWRFLDSASWLCFTPAGEVDAARSYGRLRSLADGPFVTPGFYGAMPDGTIRTFPRGGSDITGALAAAALDANLYENWTDVPGILRADPRLVPEARPVRHLTYGELTELTAVGTQVLHEGAVRPVRDAGIALQIRCTFRPEDPGTLITAVVPSGVERGRVLCLAGCRERALISLETAPRGTLETLLEETAIQPDFLTTALSRQTASVPSEAVGTILEQVGAYPGHLSLQDDLALLAVIFAPEEKRGPMAADLLSACKREDIAIHAILRPFGGHILLLAVPDGDYVRAVRLLHDCIG